MTRLLAGRWTFSWLRVGPYTCLALASMLAWSALVGTMAVLRHLAFNSTAYDLGIFDQVVWNTANGQWFRNTIMRDSPSHLGHHFSPILLALVPLYWVHADPIVLVVTQAFLVGFAGLPTFWLARELLGSPRLGMVFLLAFLLHPATAYISLFDFHEVAFAVPLLTLSVYFLLRRRYGPLVATLGALLLVKEDMGLVVAAIGVYVAVVQRQWRLGSLLGGLGGMWTIGLIAWVIPAFHPSGEYFFNYLYSEFGSSPGDVLRTFVQQPGLAWQQLTEPPKLDYLQQMLVPAVPLPALGFPVLVVALPGLIVQLLSDHIPIPLIKFQYSATVLPPLLAAAVLGYRRAVRVAGRHGQVAKVGLAVCLAVTSLLGAYLYGPLPGARHFDPTQYAQKPQFETLREMLRMIPSEASVVAQCNIVPHLSRRPAVYQFYRLDTNPAPDYYLFDTVWRGCAFWFAENDVVLGQVLADPDYRAVMDQGGYLLLRREAWSVGQPLSVVLDDQLEVVGVSLPDAGRAAGQDLGVDIYYRALGSLDGEYSLLLQLLDADGRSWGQWHGYPVGGHWMTSEWPPGHLVRGARQVPVDADAPAGEYRLVATVYRLPEMQSLRVTSPAADAGRTTVVLGTVIVASPP